MIGRWVTKIEGIKKQVCHKQTGLHDYANCRFLDWQMRKKLTMIKGSATHSVTLGSRY